MKTLHIILNAHLDPIWLWPWQAGLDEALATCRSACDRLDAHPDIVFTRGEAWVYDQVERVDPALFERIRAHIGAGRWEVVGGWWIQPDCNLPGGFAMERQISLGRTYFQSRFGLFPRTAYNVDTFGHSAGLPALLAAAGQDSYIMMRPEQHEMALPSDLFRWRGTEDGPEVLVYRVSGYQTNTEITLDQVKRCLSKVPDGLSDGLCLVGIGDHGGGPTEQQIQWCRDHRNAVPGWEIVFSSPDRFFDALRPHRDSLPLVTGELQPHAVGCYSVYRPVKTGVRRAENLLAQAQRAAGSDDDAALTEAWKRVCFHHFHDTLGGTCLPSAYPAVLDQLGGAAASADEILQHSFRRQMNTLPDDPLQRIVLYNPSDAAFDGWVEFEPWIDWWQPWLPDCVLLDAAGERVPFQIMQTEALVQFGVNGHFTRLLIPASLAPDEIKTLRIERGASDVSFAVQASSPDGRRIENDRGIVITADGPQVQNGRAWPRLGLQLIEDDTDTWGHGIDGFTGPVVSEARWTDSGCILDDGPLMASLAVDGTVGSSRVHAEWRVYCGEPFADLTLTVDFHERGKLLKLTLVSDDGYEDSRIDGVLGGKVRRPNNGAERPLQDWTLLRKPSGAFVGVVAPDVFGIDGQGDCLRLTLLRSPLMAHHVPVEASIAKRPVVADQGRHVFRFRFYLSEDLTEETLSAAARSLQQPPLAADLTRGMPAEFRSTVKRE